MPTLSRWFIKIGMLYFTLGLMMMALLMVQVWVTGCSPSSQKTNRAAANVSDGRC